MAVDHFDLPPGWKVRSEIDPLLVTVPPPGGGAEFVLSLGCLVAARITQLMGAPAGWPVGLLVAGLVLLGLYLKAAAREEWLVGSNSLSVRRKYGGVALPAGSYRDAAVVVARSFTDDWEVRIQDQQGDHLLCRAATLENAARIGEFVSTQAGWKLGSPNGSNTLLRELIRHALANNDHHWLRRLTSNAEAIPALALTWRSSPPATRASIWLHLQEVAEPRELLLQAMQSSDPAARAAAIDLLAERGDPSVAPAIRKALTSPLSEVRARAAAALGRLRDAESVTPLCRALQHGGDLPLIAATALGEIGDARAVPDLIGVLTSGTRAAEADLRWTAAAALGRIGDPSAAPALCRALRDPIREVREGAAEALGALASETAVPALCEALADPEERVVLRAAAALGHLQSSAAVEPLCRSFDAKSPAVRAQVLRSLGEIGCDESLPTLCRGLTERSAEIRREAADALHALARACDEAPIRLRTAIPLLEKMLAPLSTERGDVKRACRLALRQIEQRTASVKDLPLPAEHGQLSPTTLPRPVDEGESISLQRGG